MHDENNGEESGATGTTAARKSAWSLQDREIADFMDYSRRYLPDIHDEANIKFWREQLAART